MNDDLKRSHQRPEGRVIAAAAKRSGKSIRQVAKDAGLSEGRVRQIINGYKTESGSVIPIVGPVSTIAGIASAAGARPSDMRDQGLDEVADEMVGLRSVGAGERPGSVTLQGHAEHVEQLQRWLEDVARDSYATPPTGPLAMWDFEQLIEAVGAKHRDELRLKDWQVEIAEREVDHYAKQLAKGGDGNEGSTAPNTAADSELSAAPDELPAAAKEGLIEEAGEFNT